MVRHRGLGEVAPHTPARQQFRKFHTTARVLILAWTIAGLASPAPAQDELVDPDRPWVAEADQLFRDGQLEEAATAYSRLLKDHGDDPALWIRVSAVRLRLKQADEALEAARTVRRLSPDDPEGYLVLSQAEAAAVGLDQAFKTLEAGIARFPEDIPLLETLATAHVGTGRWGEAAGLLRQLIRLNPTHPLYRLDLGRILLQANELESARAELNAALDSGADAASCHALLGQVALASGELQGATQAFEASLAAQPNAPALAGLGSLQFMQGQRDEAVQSFQEALRLSPDDPEVHFNLANVLVVLDRPEEAKRSLRRSIELDPEYAPAHQNLGILLLSGLDVAGAQTHLKRAVGIDPELASPYLHLARIAAADFDYDAAQKHYESYRDRIPEAAERGRIDDVLRDLEKAREQSRAALQRGEVHLLQAIVSKQSDADGLIRRVREGEDFYVLAQDMGAATSLSSIDVGFVRPDDLNKVFRKAVARLDVGALTDPVKTARGYHVFYRVE